MRRMLVGACCAVILGSLGACGDDGGGDSSNGVIQFAAATFTVNEDGTAVAPVTVRRTGGSDGAVSATLQLADGSATGGAPPLAPPEDYDNSPIVVTFADGDAVDKVVTIPVLDDSALEPNETVNLTLALPTGGAIVGIQPTAVLVIANNDFAGVLDFSAPTYSYSESGTPITQITVTRTGGSSGAVSVTVTSADGTANSDPGSNVEPVDYNPLNTVVTFGDQDTTDKVVALPLVVQDALPEVDETFSVTLGNPTNGAVVGPAGTATVTIVDDDAVLALPNPTPAAAEEFGTAVAAVAGRIAVGVPGQTLAGVAGAGEVDLFDPIGGAVAGIIINPNGYPAQCCATARFGQALAGNGSEVLIGSPSLSIPTTYAGAFLYDARNLTLHLAVTDFYGTDLGAAVALLPTTFAVGSPLSNFGQGAIEIHDRLTGGFVGLVFGVGNDDGLGNAIVAAGDRYVVGASGADLVANNSGAVFVFGGATGALLLQIQNPYPSADDHFGASVAVVGSLIAVGAPDSDWVATNAGAVYLFDGATGAFVTNILPQVVVAGGRFGASLASVRDRLAVYQEGGGPGAAGVVYVYAVPNTYLETINHPAPTANAGFGAAMAEFDGALIVGAPRQDVAGQVDAGAAWVFKVN